MSNPNYISHILQVHYNWSITGKQAIVNQLIGSWEIWMKV